jgi:hypothetical protein
VINESQCCNDQLRPPLFLRANPVRVEVVGVSERVVNRPQRRFRPQRFTVLSSLTWDSRGSTLCAKG